MSQTPFTADEMDAAYAAVLDRHPDIDDERLARKARRVAATMRHANDPRYWSQP